MKEKNWKVVNFGAGKAFDAFGHATPFWTGAVTYKWNAENQMFRILAVQALGTGTVINSRSYDSEEPSQDGVNDFLDYFKELENHYKKVYGE